MKADCKIALVDFIEPRTVNFGYRSGDFNCRSRNGLLLVDRLIEWCYNSFFAIGFMTLYG